MAKQTKDNKKLKLQQKANKKAASEAFKSSRSVTSLIPIKEVYNDTFKYNDNSFMDVIQVVCKDLKSASDNEVNIDLYILAQFNRTYSDDYKLISINFPTNTKTQQLYFQHKIMHTSNPLLQNILKEKLDELIYDEQTSTNREHYIMVFGNSYEQLTQNREAAVKALKGLVEYVPLFKKIQMLFMLANKAASIFYDDTAAEYVHKDDNAELVKKYGYNPHLMKSIQPMGGVSFANADSIRTGSGMEACLYIYEYPKNVDRHWLSYLTNNAGTITTIDVETLNSYLVKADLNKSIVEYKSQAHSEKNIVKAMDAETAAQELNQLAYEVSSGGEIIKRVTTRIFIAGKTYEELQRNIEHIQRNLESNGYKSTINLNEQKYEWTSMYKSVKQQKVSRSSRKGRNIMSTTLGGGNPFHFTYLNDKYGSHLGRTTTSGVDGKVLFDCFDATNTRTYYNTCIVGEMGMGKSTLTKKIVRDRAARGDYIRILDNTGEYRDTVLSLGGKIVALDGTDGILNMFQINKESDKEVESFAMHVSKLSAIYSFLAPESSQQEKLVYESAVRRMYKKFGLIPEMAAEKGILITELPANRYPILQDLIPVIKELITKEKNTDTIKYLTNIKLVVENLVQNYGYIFNGYTNIDDVINTQVVSFNIKSLSNLKQEIFDSQLFSALTLCWANAVKIGSKMKKDYEDSKIDFIDIKHFLLILDESSKTINADKPYAIKQVLTYAKEGRKYQAGLLFASQSIRDYVPEGTSEKNHNRIKALFELCMYKFVMRQDANALDTLRSVFENNFTETEINSIQYLEKGQAILSIKGNKNITIQVEVTKDELAMFKGGI